MKRFVSAFASTTFFGLALTSLACAPTTPRVAMATTPVGRGVVTPPSDCGSLKEPFQAELCAMGEPTLSTAGPETYRFLWMRHLHNPIAVRLSRAGGSIAVATVEANTNDPRDKRHHEFTTNTAPWKSLLGHLESADFWNLLGDPGEDERGLDGADWVIEGRRGGVYHAVVRWNPPPGPFRSACEDFIAVSGLAFPTEMR